MSIKYGPVLTYRDVDEAKKLIGKNVIGSDFLGNIEYEDPTGSIFVTEGKLGTIKDNDAEPFVVSGDYCQFIREVIKEEPKYRPFKDVNELIEHWEKNYGNSNRPHGTMPLIWIRPKISDGSMQEAILITEFWSDGVCTTYSEYVIIFEDLCKEWIFLDGKPCGVEVEE